MQSELLRQSYNSLILTMDHIIYPRVCFPPRFVSNGNTRYDLKQSPKLCIQENMLPYNNKISRIHKMRKPVSQGH